MTTTGPAPPAGDAAAADLVLAHVSDPHFGAHSPEVARALVADVWACRPTVTVITGDLTMRARRDQFAEARAFLDQLPQPLLVVPGNHDIPLFDLYARFTDPYRRYLASFGELEPVLDAPGVRTAGLASMPPWRWKSGRISHRQAERAVGVLATAPGATVRVLALHHPPDQRGLAALVGGRRLRAAMLDAQVDLVLAGHTHVPDSYLLTLGRPPTTRPVLAVVAGTATSTRLRGVPRSWTLIRVGTTATTVEHRRHDGGRWRGGPALRYPAPLIRSG